MHKSSTISYAKCVNSNTNYTLCVKLAQHFTQTIKCRLHVMLKVLFIYFQKKKRKDVATTGRQKRRYSHAGRHHNIWIVPFFTSHYLGCARFYSNLIYCKKILMPPAVNKIMQHDMTRWTHQCLLVFCQWSHCGLAK